MDGTPRCLEANNSKDSGVPTTTPLKTNMSPENQWLEDVFPVEIYSPFLGDILVFRGVQCQNLTDFEEWKVRVAAFELNFPSGKGILGGFCENPKVMNIFMARVVRTTRRSREFLGCKRF